MDFDQINKLEEGQILCCCEYFNSRGQRSHLLEALCDCQVLDDICEGFIHCKWAGKDQFLQLLEVMHDRIRIPWLDGRGARRFPLSTILPMIILPCMLKVASSGFYTTVGMITSLFPLMMFIYYSAIISGRKRTPFFLSWTLTSILGMLFAYLRYITPNCSLDKTAEVSLGLVMTLIIFILCLRNPGRIKPKRKGAKLGNYVDHNNQDTYDNNLLKVCQECHVQMPRRSHHCGICHKCVKHFDHHCVWINNCVGQGNRRLFVLLLLVFLYTASRGIYFSLDTVCVWDKMLPNCQYAYEEDW
ncbi:uncharacterized protein TRIADDRAFT_62103 [Trichoplax adhaerens]|uniref:Palmitoyltransferase n=1 Tax=Trichoplax adhaerens TaxID=10228 RepID=B3SCU8_TRIAD|nr:hypothetical protein TRIADDRAFT_62103 [Trichoplax adhaerens]EDV19450.1 hypothetical protein TRIADDRAFT_62103 [Trichoplax adhaerens]|eukprot:XP_002118050.1 hypothetical protein TRIADDRAFT_62103 [Trichoplax adhaerens]